MHFLCFKMREKIYIADRAHQESLARTEYKFYTARVKKRYEIYYASIHKQDSRDNAYKIYCINCTKVHLPSDFKFCYRFLDAFATKMHTRMISNVFFYIDSPWEGSRAKDHSACRASASWSYCVSSYSFNSMNESVTHSVILCEDFI